MSTALTEEQRAELWERVVVGDEAPTGNLEEVCAQGWDETPEELYPKLVPMWQGKGPNIEADAFDDDGGVINVYSADEGLTELDWAQVEWLHKALGEMLAARRAGQ